MTPPPLVAQATVPSPLGPLLLAARARGLAGCWFSDQRHHPGPLDAPVDARHPHIAQAVAELADYWRDARTARFRVPLDPAGTPFQQAVWRALLDIAPGRSSAYGGLATALGAPQAARAVGAAVGRNPLSVIVPCHRVLGRDGALTGYAGGLARKQALLQREGHALAAQAAAGEAVCA
ncbi:methylated-DNA--[protein]-cysteine S-methyltransferase [Ideonella sp.]|uniref:methylated-DNA--[protein]-cysteine S-methyltransferase n=1 Tax=Ideonella sp. TaxID=1929293 RepID=UPI0035B457CE